MMHGWGGYGYGGFGMGLVMVVCWLIGLAILGFAIYGIMRWSGKVGCSPVSRPAGNAPDNSLIIVNERYARGEITREEFETMKADLKA